jgi:hypothetical protein
MLLILCLRASRFQLMKLACAEYETVVARLRVQTGLTHAPPPATDEVFEAGDSVSVHHEKSRAEKTKMFWGVGSEEFICD